MNPRKHSEIVTRQGFYFVVKYDTGYLGRDAGNPSKHVPAGRHRWEWDTSTGAQKWSNAYGFGRGKIVLVRIKKRNRRLEAAILLRGQFGYTGFVQKVIDILEGRP